MHAFVDQLVLATQRVRRIGKKQYDDNETGGCLGLMRPKTHAHIVKEIIAAV
jgi:hypothetical protein